MQSNIVTKDEISSVINNSPDNPEKTQRGPGGRVKHWDHKQNAWAIGASGSSIRKDSPDKPKRTHQELAEGIAARRTLADAMVREKSAGSTRATRDKAKWQSNRTGDSPVYIKFLHIV